MRELVIAKLSGFIGDSDGYGIPRYFDCLDDEYITDPAELEGFTDEELLEVFESTVGFGG